EPLKMLSVEGPFQRVQREDTEEPKPDASIPHHGRKTLASARAPARREIRLIPGKLALPRLVIAGTRLHRTWILTGFMFFIIEQSVNNALKPSISPNFESKGDHMKVACDDR